MSDYFARQAQLDLVELSGAFDRAFMSVVPDDPADSTPSQLHQAMRHATLNGGKRIRPRLLLAAAEACNGGPMDEDMAELALRAAMAVELIHAASLVHDDLPCFDDADLRRGQPTVHRAYGEALAVLTGDALITLAFETLADYEGPSQRRALKIVRLLSEAAGSARGIIGGQSLELAGPAAWEDQGAFAIDFVEEYHEKKTAALFDYATRAAALAVGVDPSEQEQWGDVGTKLGLAFQLIDDLYDIHSSEQETGKTTGRDRALQRPNGAILEGSDGAVRRLSQLIDDACEGVFAVARKPDPVLRLMESFDAMLCGLELGDVANGKAGESGIFSARVLARGVA
jgi:geranylgeranyl diphosphate synthase type II